MIEKSWVEVESFWGLTVKNLFFTHSGRSKGLVVLFPGGNYRCDAPLLHYARKATLLAGYDVLSIDYGFQVVNVKFSFDYINQVIQEALEAVRQCLECEYEQVYFISKSMGTCVAGEVSKELGYEQQQNLFLTPIPQTIPHILAQPCSVVVGTRDKFFGQEQIEEIAQVSGVNLRIFEGAGHSLEISDDYRESLRILTKVTELCEEFVLECS